MKKKVKVWLVVAVSLMAAGVVIGAVSLVGVFMNGGLETVKYETNETVVSEEFSNISLKLNTSDVEILPSEDGSCRVVSFAQKNVRDAVSVENGTLTLVRYDERKWYERVGIFFRASKVTVYLPVGVYGDLSVALSTGDLKVAKELGFASASIQGTTGDVFMEASVTGACVIRQSTGEILVKDVHAGRLELTTTTGEVCVRSAVCVGDVTVSQGTGDAELTDLQAATLTLKGTTGDAELVRVVATGSLTVQRSTGDVELEACDASSLLIRTGSGDVKGRLLSEKDFRASATTGQVRVPDTRTGGLCEITTTTGDIHITLVGQ